MKRFICSVFLISVIALPFSASAEGERDVSASTQRKTAGKFDSWIYAKAICAGTVLDKQVQLDGGIETESLFALQVTAVLFGDPELKTLYVPKTGPFIQAGHRILVAVRGDSYSPPIIVTADTTENRRNLEKAIEGRRNIRVEHGFLDSEALLERCEALLRSYLAAIAARLPDHAHLGKDALKNIEFHQCKAPLGVYIRIMESYKWGGRFQQMQPVPNKDGIVLWVAATLENFDVGHPTAQLDQSTFLGFAGDRELDWEQKRHLNHWSLRHPPTSGPISLNMYASYIDPTGNSELGKVLRDEFQELREKLQDINRDPPRDLNAATSELLGHKKALPALMPSGDILPVGSFHYGTTTLGQAYEALSSKYALDRLSDNQKKLLVPLLIELLFDTTVVKNYTPSDGRIVLSHQMAYPLLKNLTGEKLPPPLSQEKGGGRRPLTTPQSDLPQQVNDFRKAGDQAAKRLGAWRAWWKKQKTDMNPTPNKPVAGDGK